MIDEEKLQSGQLPEEFSRIATIREEPINYMYQPPEGAVLIEPPKEGLFYQVGSPTLQTDRLQAYERRYIIPIALVVAPIFGGLSPITDDIYRKIPEYYRLKNMFCIISRSRITKTAYGLDWDSVVVVVRKFCVVRINTILDPGKDKFHIRKVLLWSRKTQRYEIAEDPSTGVVNATALPYILETYNKIEGIVKPSDRR